MVRCLAFRTPEYLPVAVRVVLHDAVLWVLEGVELVRRAIKSGDGNSHLLISPQCVRLIEAMECYHYADSSNTTYSELPDKDGVYDHPIDALRYFFVNYKTNRKTKCRRY